MDEPNRKQREPLHGFAGRSQRLQVVAALVIPVLFIVPAAPGRAQDRVILKRAPLSGRITVSGTIEDYTGKEISIRGSQGEAVRKYPAEEVVSIETTETEAHERGLKALRENQVEEAIREFDAALRIEPRAWVRREILSLLVRAAMRRGEHVSAGVRFLELIKSDPTTPHFRTIPLLWIDEPLPDATRSQAKAWMDGSLETARLIGASLLFDDPGQRILARSTMRQLASSTDRRIQLLAQTQLWRIAASEQVGDLEIVRWQERVDGLPPDLRAGPAFVLGRAYAARHDYELAAATFLWLPLVDDHDYRLSARACFEAAVAMGRIGQQPEALRLYRETVQRYGETPSAAEAQRRLKAAAEPPSTTPQLK